MSYEEKKIIFNKKWLIIIGVLVAGIGILSVLLLFKNTNQKKQLLLECSASNTIDNINLDINIKIYKNNGYILSSDIKVVTDNLINYNSMEYSKSLLDTVVKQQFKDVEDYYDYSIKFYDKSAEIKINNYINENSELLYTKYLGVNLLDYSIKDIKKYFGNGGFECKEK